MSIRKTLIEYLDEICSRRAQVLLFTYYDESVCRPYSHFLAYRILQYSAESSNNPKDYLCFSESFRAGNLREQRLKNNFPLFDKSYVC